MAVFSCFLKRTYPYFTFDVRDIVNDFSFKAIVIDFFDFSSKFIFWAVCVGIIALLFIVLLMGLETDFKYSFG